MTTIPVELYDSSLRDGLQWLKVKAGLQSRIEVAHRLDELGVAVIEWGWPGANPLFTQFFEQMKKEQLIQAKLAAFGSTRKVSWTAANDSTIQHLLRSETPIVTLFWKSDIDHVTKALKTDGDENLRMIEDSISTLKNWGRDVYYDAEHFFDGYAKDPAYALKTLQIAVENGASRIILCDTNGVSLPHIVSEVTQVVHTLLWDTAIIGIHAHNDLDCATANTLAALFAGARHVQGTFGGFWERTGNANLAAIIWACHVKTPYRLIPDAQEENVCRAAYFIGEKMSRPVPLSMPVVGPASFTHKWWVHADAVLRDPALYEWFEPTRFGGKRQIAISGVAGTANLLHWAGEFGIHIRDKRDPKLWTLLARIKSDEEQGIDYEMSYGSLELLFQEYLLGRKKGIDVKHFSVSDTDGTAMVSLTIKVWSEERTEAQSSMKWVFDATFDLFNRMLKEQWLIKNDIQIVQYRSEPLDVSDVQSEAKVQTTISFKHDNLVWTTTHTHPDRVQADLEALRQGFDFLSLKSSKTA